MKFPAIPGLAHRLISKTEAIVSEVLAGMPVPVEDLKEK
jgi:hypothetical protein